MGFKKGNKIGNRFTSDNQPQKSGRRKNIVSRMEEDRPYSNADIVLLLSRHLNMTTERVIAAAGKDDMKMTAGEKIAARFIANGIAKGDPAIFELIAKLNPNRTEMTGRDGAPLIPGTPEEKEAEIERIKGILKEL